MTTDKIKMFLNHQFTAMFMGYHLQEGKSDGSPVYTIRDLPKMQEKLTTGYGDIPPILRQPQPIVLARNTSESGKEEYT